MKNIQEIYNKAIELHQKKRLDEAKVLYEKILTINPNQIDALYSFSVLCMSQNQNDKAIEMLEKAISIRPNKSYYNNLGILLSNKGRNDKAIEMFEKAIELDSNYANAYQNLGIVLKEQGKLDKSLEVLYKAILINPNYVSAYNVLGAVLDKQNKFDEAIKIYKKAIELDPNYCDAYYNLGITFKDLAKLDDAMDMFDKAISINNNHIDSCWNKSLIHLMLGDFEEGFRLYESRWEVKNNLKLKRNYSQPLWLGKESLCGKTILIYSEQGFGDTIQFCRYIDMLKNLECNIIFELESNLISLLSQIKGVDKFISKGEPMPPFDYHCPLLSLPLAFKTSLETIPSSISYLKADINKVESWNNSFGLKRKPRIGIVWSSVSMFKDDSKRSMLLEQFIKCFPEDKYELVCLQKVLKEEDKEFFQQYGKISFYGDKLNDFSDTAGLISCMDLVISVDTSVAHLSGALGIPTWILIPFVADWRWLQNRSDSPWYQSVRLFRQNKMDDWKNVVDDVNTKLKEVFSN